MTIEELTDVMSAINKTRDLVVEKCPQSRETSLVLTKLDEAGLWLSLVRVDE